MLAKPVSTGRTIVVVQDIKSGLGMAQIENAIRNARQLKKRESRADLSEQYDSVSDMLKAAAGEGKQITYFFLTSSHGSPSMTTS